MVVQQFSNGRGFIIRPNGPALPLPRPDLISDSLAVGAILDANQNLPIPISLTPNQNAMRRKMSYPRTFSAYPRVVSGLSASPRIRGAGPLIVKSLAMLQPMACFADDTTMVDDSGQPMDASQPADTTQTDYVPTGADYGVQDTPATPAASGGVSFGSQLLSALPSLVQAGTGIYTATNQPGQSSSGLTARTTLAPTGQVQSSGGSSTTLLLLGGAAVVLFLMMSSRSAKRR